MQITTIVRRTALIFLSMVFSVGIVFAQQRTITGKVTAEGEGPVPGVTVVVQGTTVGTITDMSGAYSIRVQGPSSVLVFSFVGYQTKQVTVGSQSTIDVVLISDVVAVSEVVVTGYSSQRKRDITGAVGVVETTALKAVPTGNITSQLQGRTSGITVVGSGQPGQTSRLRIRGFSSFENNDPLYIVDGVPTQNIASINPNDVESISVLKDAGAASIYGSRASNGVIVITTKKGAIGVKVTYDMYTGTQLPGGGPTKDLLNTKEYANLQWLVYKNDGTTETHPIYGPSSNATPTLPSWAADTDWYKTITRNASISNHDVTLSGGNDNAKFFAGVGAFIQNGIIKHTDTKKYTARFNSEFKILEGRVTIGENFAMTYGSSHGVGNLNEGSPIQMGPYRSQPIVPAIITTPIKGTARNFVPGEYGGTGLIARLGNNSNVLANLERAKDNNNYNLSLIGSAFVDVKIMDGLNFRSRLGGTFFNGAYYSFNHSTYERSENVATPSMTEGANYGGNWTWANTVSYNKTFGDHKVSAVAGYESNKISIYRELSGQRAGYFSDAIDYRNLSNGQTIVAANSFVSTPVTLVSQFAKADYSFRDKYLFSATIRRDGSSVFSDDKRYGIFPSFSAGWRIKDESFLKDLSWLNDLKLRGSWGTMGNQLAVSPANAYSLYGGETNNSFYDISGTGNSSAQGFRKNRIGNPDAQWEINVTTDIGFEATLFDSKIGIVFDWYSKQTKDLLFNPELPGTAGSSSQPFVNIASMSNKGLDIELTYKNTFGDLGFNASAVITTVNNEITKVADGVNFFDWGGSRIGSYNRNQVGHPMSSFFGYQVAGLFQNDAEVASAAKQDGAAPGFFRYADINNDKVIDPKDRTFIGNPNPDFTYGLNLAFTYKNFDISTFLYGSQGNDIFNNNKWWVDFWPSFQGQKSQDLLYRSWTTSNTSATVPKASNKSNFSTNTVSSSYYLEDGSFVRMKNLQIGYTMPASSLSKVYLKSVRVYVQAVNLFTITKYSGLDPEIGGGDRAFGVDSGNYPNVKQFIIGLNLTL
ncbi:MAG: TonB-dependent receptor [Bacteroidota bacterium]|nr:SusC/RagA family TonB-linked outer membrane protein [Odoribacter sp.]MDP3642512.1 TonB-dependent receptor [Bacteroidota bacterium]